MLRKKDKPMLHEYKHKLWPGKARPYKLNPKGAVNPRIKIININILLGNI